MPVYFAKLDEKSYRIPFCCVTLKTLFLNHARFAIPQYSGEDDGHHTGNSMLVHWVGPRILFWQCDVMCAFIMSVGCSLHVLDPDGRQLMLPVKLLHEDYLAPSPDK